MQNLTSDNSQLHRIEATQAEARAQRTDTEGLKLEVKRLQRMVETLTALQELAKVPMDLDKEPSEETERQRQHQAHIEQALRQIMTEGEGQQERNEQRMQGMAQNLKDFQAQILNLEKKVSN